MAITFHTLSPISLKKKTLLKVFLYNLFKENGRQLANLDVIFCTDPYLRDINNRFLQHDYFTDIITFNLSVNSTEPITGEIYISIDRIKENASTFKKSINNELHRVIFHGALHLCGYQDKTKADKVQMNTQEDKYLSAYF